MEFQMRKKFVAVLIAAASMMIVTAPAASAGPEPTGNPQGEAKGNGCDMGPFHSNLAKQGEIGKNKTHYPGQHKGASTC